MNFIKRIFIIIPILLLTGCNINDIHNRETTVSHIDYNLENYRTINIGKNEITLPCSYREFKKFGYELENEYEILKPVSDIPQRVVTDKNGNQMYIMLVNHSTKEKKALACDVYGITADYRNTSDEINYLDVIPGMSKDEARNTLKLRPVEEYINTLENGYSSDIWYLVSDDADYLRKGKIDITYQDDIMCSVTINCLDFN